MRLPQLVEVSTSTATRGAADPWEQPGGIRLALDLGWRIF